MMILMNMTDMMMMMIEIDLVNMSIETEIDHEEMTVIDMIIMENDQVGDQVGDQDVAIDIHQEQVTMDHILVQYHVQYLLL